MTTNKFASAVSAQTVANNKAANKTQTTNGAKAFKSTLNANVDFFGTAAASRGRDVTASFAKAFNEDPDMALRNALYLRDVRGGAGERDTFRSVLKHLASVTPKTLLDTTFLEKTAEVGRWDDLLELVDVKFDQRIRDKVTGLYKQALIEKNGLAAKWAPRKGEVASRLRTAFGWTPKFYRKTIVGLTNVVETQMCAKQWDYINFNHVPSKAMTLYSRAFQRNAVTAFNLYKEALANGTAKVNASAVFPYDVYMALKRDNSTVNDAVFEAQWKSLPDYIGEEINILPMIDISGSMECPVGGQKSMSCMDVSVSLGLYMADRIKGPYNGMYMTFTDQAIIGQVDPKMTLRERFNYVRGKHCGYNTNLQAAFAKILSVAVQNKVPQKDMPSHLVILSDMQFDVAQGSRGAFGGTGYSMAKQAYKDAGYEVPKIIFWNLNAYDNVPVKFDKDGTALVSGYSPSILKAVLSAKFDGAQNITPMDVMVEALMVDRYDVGIAA